MIHTMNTGGKDLTRGKSDCSVQLYSYSHLTQRTDSTPVFIERLTSLYQAIISRQMSFPQLTDIWKEANGK